MILQLFSVTRALAHHHIDKSAIDMYANGTKGRAMQYRRHLRKRGAAVVIRHGKLLLVKDRGRHRYSLPGGGVKKHERSYQAAARELYEETGLRAKKIKWIGSFEGAVSEHKAYLIEADGHVHLKRHGELKAYLWWDMKKPVPIYGHVMGILKMLNKETDHAR